MKTEQQNTTLLTKNRGFTLIEVLVAIAIFSIGILAVGSMQLWNTKNNTTANIMTLAAMLARQKIEELKTVSDVTSLTDGNDTVGIFTREWDVNDPPSPLSSSTCKLLQVTVSWNKGGPRSVVLTSITRGNGT
jgi:type IV pilus modification protein PilV